LPSRQPPRGLLVARAGLRTSPSANVEGVTARSGSPALMRGTAGLLRTPLRGLFNCA
jgi:hypothetical protein